jgi:tetratricopeptide (TPR) repeat protein
MNLKCFKKFNFLLFFIIFSCSPVEQEDSLFRPSITVDPNASLDCSGIWSGSQLCLERNEALIDLKKFDELFQKINPSKDNSNTELIEKLKLIRQEGDKFYTDEFYFKARDSYQSAIIIIEEFNKKEAILIEDLILKINSNLNLGRLEEAKLLLNKLESISNVSDLESLKSRINNYYEINDLIEESRYYLANNNFEQAIESINLAIYLDNQRLDSIQLKDEIKIRSDQYYFDLYIQLSYEELNNSNINTAFDYFNKAEKIFDSSEELIILGNSLQKYKKEYDLSQFIKLADSSSDQERWEEAISNYKSALELNPNSSSLLIKLKRVESLNSINNKLNEFMKSPERLSSKRIRDSFLMTINQGLSYDLKNEKNLILNLQKARDFYKQYSVMITLNISSNNRTYVDILKTVQYQPFINESIKLYPGNYVIVAKRKGLQSFRMPIIISPDSDVLYIDAVCDKSCSVSYDNEFSMERSPKNTDAKINSSILNMPSENTYIKGAKIINSSFTKYLVCDRPTKNKLIKISFSVSVDRSGNVISLQRLGENRFNTEDKNAVSVVERALRKSRFRLPANESSNQLGKIKHTISIPQNFCDK